MIGYNTLGTNGRLGNQMFQYASLRGIAEKHGYDFCIPPEDHPTYADYALFLAFKMEGIKTGLISGSTLSESGYEFDENLFNTCPDNVNLNGYYQTEKYFKHAEKNIRKDFTFHDSILQPCKDMIDSVDGDPIMLHVRRGDPNLTDPRGFKWSYTQCGSMHPVQPIEYYEKALSKFDAKQPVIVFSDSVDWVKEQEFFKPDRFLISEPEDKYADGSFTPYADLCLMSLCSHAIIANSTMSWWGAWLISNPNKQVIAPKMWFGPAYADKDTKDLYYPNWIVL